MATSVSAGTSAPHPSELDLPPGDLWVFGYGSLMWDPGFHYERRAPALVYGYHRAFCIYSSRWRGTPDEPGLVLGLNRGGACHGIAYRIAASRVAATIRKLWAREMSRRIYKVRLLRAQLPKGEARAFTFVADPQHPGYAGTLPLARIAQRIATCRGVRGTNIEYLTRTIEHLAALGVRDHNLLRVMEAVRALQSR